MSRDDWHILLERLKAGDESAGEQIYQGLFVRFRVVAKRRVRNECDAEDLAQDACLTVLSKCRTEEFTKNFLAWAYGVLRMKIGNYIQSARNSREVCCDGTEGERDLRFSVPPSEPGLLSSLLDCLRKIVAVHPRYARVLNLAYQGYESDSICRKLNVSRTNMYVILNRGRSLLRRCLQTGKV